MSLKTASSGGVMVSIILTTKNEEKHVERCLKSLVSQVYERTEIILVDNDSTDDTVKIASQYTDHIYNIGPERSAQRNHGAKVAKGEYLLFVDADMILSPGVVEEAVERLEAHPGQGGLYIPERIIGEGFWVKVRDFERSFYNATVVDAVRFIRKSTFQLIQGFDESLTGPEDWDFDKKVRGCCEVGLISSPLFHNEDGFNIEGYLAKKSYYGEGFHAYRKKWGGNDPDLKRQFGFLYRYFWVFMEKGRFVKLIRHPMLTLGMYLLRFQVGLGYLATLRKERRLTS